MHVTIVKLKELSNEGVKNGRTEENEIKGKWEKLDRISTMKRVIKFW